MTKTRLFTLIALAMALTTIMAPANAMEPPEAVIQQYEQNFDRGYRGFAHVGYTVGFGKNPYGRVSIETSHGFQFNNWFFLGGGIGFNIFHGLLNTQSGSHFFSIPAYATVRFDIPTKGIVNPYFEIRDGIAAVPISTSPLAAYLQVGLGMRIAGHGSVGYNIGASYELLHCSELINTTIYQYPFSGVAIRFCIDFSKAR